MSPRQPRLAWRDVDMVLVGFSTTVGMAAWIAAWVGAHRAEQVTQQTVWLNLGVVGIIVFGVGNGLWLLRGRRAVGERRSSLVRLEAKDETAAPLTSLSEQTVGTGAGVRRAGLVRLSGAGLAHRAECPLVGGKQVEPADLVDSKPCGVCLS